jgi:catechol 2,3-dioxygenase-like lactoylglutathione lyase family enzyme
MTIATKENTTMARLPMLSDGIALTHFIVAEDVERAAHFYSDILGGEIVLAGQPTIVALANSWIIINVGGGPTDDKPTITLEPPHDPDRVSSFLNIRVADIQTTYQTWSERGAQFLTPPIDRASETRCYLRDPDGHLIEVGQSNQTDRSAD